MPDWDLEAEMSTLIHGSHSLAIDLLAARSLPGRVFHVRLECVNGVDLERQVGRRVSHSTSVAVKPPVGSHIRDRTDRG